jgi:Protein of unknown function (DUF2878)
MPNIQVIINFVLFQAAWFACVLGAANQQPYLGVIVTLLTLAWHLKTASKPIKALKLLGFTLLIGAIFDQCLLSFNLMQYQAHGWQTSIVPIWILALWLGFASALNVSLRWMRGKKLLMLLFGAIGGPLAYLSAEKLGAVVIQKPLGFVVLSVGWAILTLLLVRLSQHFDGFES